MIPYALLIVLLSAAAIGLCILAARTGKPVEDTLHHNLIFRHGLVFRLLSLGILLLLPAALVVVLLRVQPKTTGDYAWYAAFIAVAVLVGAFMTWDALRFRLVATQTALQMRSPWRGSVVVPWTRVTAVSFSTMHYWFVVIATTGETIRVSALVPGLSRFLELAEQKLSPEKLLGARAGYHWVGKSKR